MEAEVFGAERGAYTGAVASHVGYVETAEGGTLFSTRSAAFVAAAGQAAHVLESRTYRRVGSSVERRADIQTVVATNMDLHAAVERGAFREDLLHRLEIIVLRMPPLRDRGPDRHAARGAPARRDLSRLRLAAAAVRRRRRRSSSTAISGLATSASCSNALEQILLLKDDPTIAARHFMLRGQRKPTRSRRASAPTAARSNSMSRGRPRATGRRGRADRSHARDVRGQCVARRAHARREPRSASVPVGETRCVRFPNWGISPNRRDACDSTYNSRR